MREKLPGAPALGLPTITSTYVDNVAIIGARKKDVENRAQRINEAFEQKASLLSGPTPPQLGPRDGWTLY